MCYSLPNEANKIDILSLQLESGVCKVTGTMIILL